MTFNTSDKTVAKTWGWEVRPGTVTDPLNHWVNGSAIHGGQFAMPIITHVRDNFYQGGFVEGIDLGDTFDTIVSLYPWEKYPANGKTYQYEMYDGGEVDADTIERAAAMALAALDRGEKVLVHCQAGLNRSGVVAARVLMRQGMSADEAITLLRKRSNQVLCNTFFERWLRQFDG